MERMAERMSTKIAEDTTDLEHELEKLRNDLRRLKIDAGLVGADALRTARTGLNESFRAAGTQGRAAIAGAEKQITEHPFLAVGAALAVGILVGYRVTRRS
ncbi:MAG: hypothetical protein RL136_903 [Planctomycetota bacterium]|jgi:ElaB/YqjD/DUF883 family membrane-anchored ribosome-binding protein